MKSKSFITFLFSGLLCIISCKESTDEKSKDTVIEQGNFEKEKASILETLHTETEAAFQRNYDNWQDKWVHDPKIVKTYINFVDTSFSESVGWDKISDFVKEFMKEHPKPEPVPKLVDDIDVRLYNNGAWVSFEQQDSLRGLKRETRLMEKVNGKWKIAGMHTTIYGFKK